MRTLAGICGKKSAAAYGCTVSNVVQYSPGCEGTVGRDVGGSGGGSGLALVVWGSGMSRSIGPYMVLCIAGIV